VGTLDAKPPWIALQLNPHISRDFANHSSPLKRPLRLARQELPITSPANPAHVKTMSSNHVVPRIAAFPFSAV